MLRHCFNKMMRLFTAHTLFRLWFYQNDATLYGSDPVPALALAK
jgi:hypothetical protein